MRTIISCALIYTLLSFASCVPEETPPVAELSVSTDTPTNVTDIDATLGGDIVTPGESAITSKGICIGLTANPTTDDVNDLTFELGNGTGAFEDDYTGFDPSTTYHVRAFAINSKGTVYGENKTFTTLAAVVPVPVGCPVVNVTTDISTPTTWTTGKVYVIKNYISVTSTLTIQPGTVIKMDAGRLRVDGSGKILASGTADNRIVFTSLFDDSHCGDTNGDGNATTPTKGDWVSIYLNGGTGNTFKYCDFLYAGQNDGGYNNAVYISVAGTSFEFDNCTFANTLSGTGSEAFVFHGYYMTNPTVSKFTNNAFYNNDRPIFVNIYYNFSTTNIFHNPTNPSQKNTRNGIWLSNDTNQGATITFGVTEVPYVFTAFFNGGGSGATDVVNVNANVILKFANTSAGISRSTSRSVTINAAAILTSMKDDTRGGDTNGDGNASSPAIGDWDGYYNYDNTTYLTGANIFFAKIH